MAITKKKGLLIVESPNKAKKIQKILGADYKVLATMGHCIDLPKNKLGIELKNGFEPEYTIMQGKKKIIDEIIDWSKKVDIVLLASDPDREGESIAYLIAQKLPAKIPYKRVVFNEITSSAVKKAVANPIDIDEHLYNAQKARRVLDRLVGYKVSPLLWSAIAKNLSAGRVQSVGLKLIVDRQKEIDAFVPQEYWEIVEDLQTPRKQTFAAKLELKNKFELSTKQMAEEMVCYLKGQQHFVTDVEEKQTKQHPYPPFITSTLQRTASTVLNYPSKRTMSLAQNLFEAGHITYHRTDSTRISSEALTDVRNYITNTFGQQYLTSSPNVFKAKKGAQDAHECIRPTDLQTTSATVAREVSQAAANLYDLILSSFVASQMEDAIIDNTKVKITAGKRLLVATGSKIKFDGWLKVWGKHSGFKDNLLPQIEKDEELKVLKIDPQQKFTTPPAKYTESSLIKELEANNVGRPSTYANIISTILDRKYVVQQSKSFTPTELGVEVAEFLQANFQDLMDIGFTADMESHLDEVALGKLKWVDTIEDFWNILSASIDKTKVSLKTANVTNFVCPECGRNLVTKIAPFTNSYGVNKFFSCEGWKRKKDATSCDYSVSAKYDAAGELVPLSNEEQSLQKASKKETVYMEKDGEKVLCPSCGRGHIIQRNRKKDGKLFWACDNYPKCKTVVDDSLNILGSKKKSYKKS